MAYVDYIHCAVCDGKVLYDAECNYDYADMGDMLALCDHCDKSGYKLKVFKREGFAMRDEDIKWRGAEVMESVSRND